MELFFCHGEAVGVDGHHADDRAAEIADGFDGFEAATARGDEVFHDDDLRSGSQFALDQVFQSVIFRPGADVDEGESEQVGHQGTLRNGACGDAGHGLHFTEILYDGACQFDLEKGAEGGIGERFAVVAIDG